MAGIEPTSLRTEYLENPLCIDATNPRLSWALASSEKGARAQYQTAYRIIAAKSIEDLRAESNLVWDSGKIESEQTTHVRYAGSPLKSDVEAVGAPLLWSDTEAVTAPSTGTYYVRLTEAGNVAGIDSKHYNCGVHVTP